MRTFDISASFCHPTTLCNSVNPTINYVTWIRSALRFQESSDLSLLFRVFSPNTSSNCLFLASSVQNKDVMCLMFHSICNLCQSVSRSPSGIRIRCAVMRVRGLCVARKRRQIFGWWCPCCVALTDRWLIPRWPDRAREAASCAGCFPRRHRNEEEDFKSIWHKGQTHIRTRRSVTHLPTQAQSQGRSTKRLP
jgi:hypothetical protein